MQDETPDSDGNYDVAVEPDRLKTLRVFVTLPHDAIDDRREDFRISVRDADSAEHARYKTTFMAPEGR